jgi:hypothetical protein
MKSTNHDKRMKRTPAEAEDFAALIGLDWGSQAHELCLYDCATGAHESSALEHSPEAIAHWATPLAQRFPKRKVALCLEQARGPLISALMAYSFLVLYPVNPGHRGPLPPGL